MQVVDLLSADVSLVAGEATTVVTGITADSRSVQPGMIFAALAGATTDGARFVDAALSKGAVGILRASGPPSPANDTPLSPAVAVLAAAEPRRALAEIAARFYPRQPTRIVAITGTNGKTSVADFTRQLLTSLGRQAASLGTIGVIAPSGAVYGSLTTPDPVTLHRTLQTLADEGVTDLAMEASSHGLDQYRLDGVRLAAGAFLNLGRDHLDYHPDVAHYLSAKLGLFTRLLAPGQPAIINTDAPGASEAVAAARAHDLRVLTVGTTGETLRLTRVVRDGFRQRLEIVHNQQTYEVTLGLIGDYQAGNALAAAALAIAVGEDPSRAIAAIATLRGVPGRLEVVGERHGGLVVVDYAHKPEALAAALGALRPFVSGRLICVMGCGGNRDAGKRPIMGQIAAALADLVVVTDDNPRHEVPAEIRRAILAGMTGSADTRVDTRIMEIGDRGTAIAEAVRQMARGDVVLIAGKGHEAGQIIGAQIIPFSDQDAVRAALATPNAVEGASA